MNCPQCQMVLPQDAQFCPNCGYAIAQSLPGGGPPVGSASAPGIPPTATMPPVYQPQPSQPFYPGMAAPVPPSQPLYPGMATPSQPVYPGTPQPLTPYGIPLTGQVPAMGPAPVSSRLGQMLQ